MGRPLLDIVPLFFTISTSALDFVRCLTIWTMQSVVLYELNSRPGLLLGDLDVAVDLEAACLGVVDE